LYNSHNNNNASNDKKNKHCAATGTTTTATANCIKNYTTTAINRTKTKRAIAK